MICFLVQFTIERIFVAGVRGGGEGGEGPTNTHTLSVVPHIGQKPSCKLAAVDRPSSKDDFGK